MARAQASLCAPACQQALCRPPPAALPPPAPVHVRTGFIDVMGWGALGHVFGYLILACNSLQAAGVWQGEGQLEYVGVPWCVSPSTPACPWSSNWELW